ncbi:hypothetical protein R1flu_023311 [Riccia fluitans]|uniref:aminodeoxychorismate synthase n=1 Tax=Riccia fluitans TaxID=41844 RepID=A0ABD1XRQ1_9MARC
MSVLREMRFLDHRKIMPGMIISNQSTSSQPVAIFKKSRSFSRGHGKFEDEASSRKLVRYPASNVQGSKYSGVQNCSLNRNSASNSGVRIWSPVAVSKGSTAEVPIRTLILDNYDSYTYNLYQLLSVINGVAPVVLRNDEVTWEELHFLLYEKRAFDNVVISPGPGSPTCASDIGLCLQLLKECSDIPILGVCLGHQALGAVHGAKVVHAPEPVHGRLSEIQHNGHPLFINIPSGTNSGFKVVRYHSLVVDASTLTEDLIPTAWTIPSKDCISVSDGFSGTVAATSGDSKGPWRGEGSMLNSDLFEENNGNVRSDGTSSDSRRDRVLMGVSHRRWPHHGVQFHPESVATSYGKQILENFRNITVQFWKKQSRQLVSLDKEVHAYSLQSFVDIGPVSSLAKNHQTLPEGLSLVSDEAMRSCEVKSSTGISSLPLQGIEQGIKDSRLKKSDISEVLRLHWKKLPGVAARVGGSRSLFCKIYGEEAVEDTFWLDSSTRDKGRARFSFMGGKGGSLWQRFTYRIGFQAIDNKLPGVLRIENAAGQIKETVVQEGFLKLLDKELELRFCPEEDYSGLPFDFCGGFVGYLGYELKVECGAESNSHRSSTPDAAMFLTDQMVVVDHANDDIYVLALYKEDSMTESSGTPFLDKLNLSNQKIVTVCGVEDREKISRVGTVLHTNDVHRKSLEEVNGREVRGRMLNESGRIAAERWVEKIVRKVRGLSQQSLDGCEIMHQLNLVSKVKTRQDNINPVFVADKSRAAYIRDVKLCQELIKDGDTYEVCLTTQLRKRFNLDNRFGLYLTLREINPAPYAAWMQFGKDGPCICSSSPERFLRLDRRGVLEAKPIKGTVARGNTPEEDEILKYSLQNSEKDQAENLMIVDLLRNDLGRVCKPGSVHVPSLMAVESYSTVHTMVSTVKGEKRDDVTPVDCVKAAFPGGSMTGAPKLRTMEIIDSLEGSARGIYSGTIGYFSFNFSFDLNIVIRTLVIHEGEASLGAGGAVIALSDPAAEYEEMVLKAKAPSRAISEFENAQMTSEQLGAVMPLGS